MLCDKCKQREANVHIRQSINGVTTERNLCSECASQEQGLMNGFSPESFFGDLFETSLLKRGSGRLGSMFDFGGFDQELLGAAAGPRDRHSVEFDVGEPFMSGVELPEITVKTGDAQKEEESAGKSDPSALREQLKKAVADEDFEEAARLRDLIKKEEQEGA